MSYHFDIVRVVQCAGHLLKKYDRSIHNYTCIIKMLYMADRMSLAETGSPITGDRPMAMDKGPVLSTVLDLIRDNSDEVPQAVWSRYIETQGYDIALLLDPGEDRLSENETGVLDQVFQAYGDKKLGDLINETHKLPEWLDTYQEGTSTEMSLKTLLRAVGHEDQYDELSRKKIEDAHFAALFGS